MRPLTRIPISWVVVVGALLGMAGCAADGASRLSRAANPSSDASPRSAALLDLDGHPFDLSKQPQAAATVVVFTRTDCPISNRFAPEICRLYQTYHPRGVEFFLVYVDPSEQPKDIRRHLREYGYPCQGLRDQKHTLVAQCGASITPEAVVFGKDRAMTYLGRINDLYVDLGQPRPQPTTHELADAIESTVQGKPVATPRARAIGCLIADLQR